ncbi:hypothetical protein PV328_000269 [Microctonus aethiopoides]|uniref:Uncharacterized protein n=1 Tax=Microctonus aethiopoides TaxID=144406 RepID=A0AA39FV43_9HYME|nr:hypothetical protein PV328_000269 [Microctonus aethiopoides]
MAMIRKFGQINVANQLYRGINLFSHKNSGPLTSDDSSSHAKSPGSPIKDEPYSPRMDSSPHNSEHDDPSSPPGDEIIKAQRQHIEQLQRELYKLQQQLQQIRQTPPATVRAEIEYHGINEPTQTSDTTKIELSDETHLSCDRHYNQPVYVDKTLSMTELFTPSGMGRTLSKDIAKGVAEIYMINIANPLY